MVGEACHLSHYLAAPVQIIWNLILTIWPKRAHYAALTQVIGMIMVELVKRKIKLCAGYPEQSEPDNSGSYRCGSSRPPSANRMRRGGVLRRRRIGRPGMVR